ncbi:1-aminocyclopropane-1-carboxylate oxidase-like protein 4-like [Senna tora]|uniref:1-aminocyclopropane-1-carboxylate oxidase-like protein 4-like n=1 Tax=Senna tora TaxID=362788 RepID=A0A834WRQ0_9FABA|nr:1-aminocyclopropane-1-carboxylate oxidase-like protein 4-like [Senna tora]
MAATSPVTATGGYASQPYDRAKAVKDFDESKIGVKGLVDSGLQTIPPFFVHPPETLSDLGSRPGSDSAVPTVDLSGVTDSPARRAAAVDQIRRAASSLGFFQITNHGIPQEALDRTINSIRAFHEQSTATKARLYRREISTGINFISNVDLYNSQAASWRDTLQVRLGPTLADREEIPEVCRDEIVEWDREIRRLGGVLMGLMSEGLGLEEGKFKEMTFTEGRMMVGHYYPFCPQPDLTVGLKSHADPGVLTVLLQDHIGGLQVRSSEGWLDVKPVRGALVINVGDLLQIVSNEAYKSADHRVLANPSQEPRVSIAVFFNPSQRESVFGPLPELTSEEKPPLYRNFTYDEFMTRFFKKELDGKSLTNFFRK